MPHQHVWAWNACIGEERVQLACNLVRCPGLGAGIAPAHAGSVVGTYLGSLPHFRLDQVPGERHATQPGVEHDRWAPRADTLDMQPVAAYVDEPAGRWIRLCVPTCRNSFVAGPDQSQAQHQGEYHG